MKKQFQKISVLVFIVLLGMAVPSYIKATELPDPVILEDNAEPEWDVEPENDTESEWDSENLETDIVDPTGGNSLSTAQSISLNANYSGIFSDNNREVFYRFTIPSSGRVSLTASIGVAHVYYNVYDADGNEVWKTDQDWNSTTELVSTNEQIDLVKGVYYLRIYDSSPSSRTAISLS